MSPAAFHRARLETPTIIVIAMLAVVPECETPGPDDLDTAPVAKVPDRPNTAPIAKDGCPAEACGFNSPLLADSLFGELDLDGRPNARGMAIVEVLAPDGRPFFLDIRDGALVGIEPGATEVSLRGSALVDAEISIRRARGHGLVSGFTVRVQAVQPVAHTSDQPGSIPGYRMAYALSSEPQIWHPMCPDAESVLVVAGERYDERTLAIHSDAGGRWFRLACASDMLGKSRRMSYDPTLSADHPYYTSVGQRRATMAMLGADYCGTGQRFTRPGTALYWQNRAGWMQVGAPPDGTAAVEAGWDENGATCLNSPRLGARYTRADIADACGREIVWCTDEILAQSEWVTWLP